MPRDEDKQRICELVRLGCTPEKAAAHVGWSACQLHRLAEQDKAFGRSLREAERSFEVRNLLHLYHAGEKHWQAAAWLLERRYPDRYARRPPQVMTAKEVETCLTRFTQIVLDHIPEPDRRRHIEAALSELAKIGRGEESVTNHLSQFTLNGHKEQSPKDRE